MVQTRSQQISLLQAYWNVTSYTSTPGAASDTIAAITLNAASITGIPGGDANTTNPVRGIVTVAPNNLVRIRDSDDGYAVFNIDNAPIFGRITFGTGIYTITYLKIDNGIETQTNLPSGTGDFDLLFPEVMNFGEVPANSNIIDYGGFTFSTSGGGGISYTGGDGIDITGPLISVDLTGSTDDGLEFNTGKLTTSLAVSGNAGVMRLTGDLGGSATDPDVVGITGTAGIVNLDASLNTFSSAATGSVVFEFANTGFGNWIFSGQAGSGNAGGFYANGGSGGTVTGMGAGGPITLNGGDGGTTSGRGGSVHLNGGVSYGDNNGSEINLIAGGGSGTKNGGLITLQPGLAGVGIGAEPGHVDISGDGSVIVMDVLPAFPFLDLATNRGAIWIRSDNNLMFTDEDENDFVVGGSSAGAETLAETLVAGNITNGTNIYLTGSSAIIGEESVTIGGDISIIGGSGALSSLDGGAVNLTGGAAGSNKDGGNVNITSAAGAGTGNGGNVVITSGDGYSCGDIILAPGAFRDPSGERGAVVIGGSRTIIFNETFNASRPLVGNEGALWVTSEGGSNAIMFTDDTNTNHNLLSGTTTAHTIDEYVTGVAASGTANTIVHTISGNNQSAIVRCEVIGRSGGNQSAGFTIFGLFEDVGGTLSQIGSTSVIAFAEDTAGWDATFAISGSDIQVTVTNGDGANTANFHITGIASEQT
jgi:hypothetical protein